MDLGWRGMSPGRSPVLGTLGFLHPLCWLHTTTAQLAQYLWNRKGSTGALAGWQPCSTLRSADWAVFIRKFLQDHSVPVFHAAGLF